MRTIDTSAVIKSALTRLECYPAGSVSKREVVVTVPCDGDSEKQAWELNGRLTEAIYSYWKQAALDNPQPLARSRDELTQLARNIASSLAA